jgi:hypothetical protein
MKRPLISAKDSTHRAPLQAGSLLMAIAIVIDLCLDDTRPATLLAASGYLAVVTLAAMARSRLVGPLAVGGVFLPLALGAIDARSIASACTQAAIFALVLLSLRRPRWYGDDDDGEPHLVAAPTQPARLSCRRPGTPRRSPRPRGRRSPARRTRRRRRGSRRRTPSGTP